MRVFSMIWVVYCHTFLISRAIPEINGVDKLKWLKSFGSMPVANGTVSIDSFFFISGFLCYGRQKFAPVVVVLDLMSIGSVMAMYLTSGFTDLRGFSNKDEWGKTYTPMHTRCSPWIVGFGLGYFMHINRQKAFRISKLVQMLAWIASFVTLFAIIFGPYDTIREHNGQGTVFETAMYEGWKRVSWAIALAWITFACHFGYGGIINSFLSHPFWQPMGRLTYSLYLYHMFVLRINFGIMRTGIFFSAYNEMLFFWSSFGISLLVAIVVSLAFESPVLVLEKFIFGRGKPEKQTKIEPSTSQNVVVELQHRD